MGNFMSHIFKGKVALITGGARGIGRATALKLAQAGADIVIAYYNSSDEALKLVNEIQAMGCNALALQVDVACHQSVKDMFVAFKEKFNKLDFSFKATNISLTD